MNRPQSAAALLLALCSACALPGEQPLETVPPTAQAASRVEPVPRPGEEPRLYARDGSVVTPRASVSAPPAGAAQRDLGGSESSRYYMLELYQQVVDERDSLAGEVARLTAELEAGRARRLQLEERLAQIEAALATRETELEGLRADNVELAGRLTTAQIRRLQAEKLLLESRLESTRIRLLLEAAPEPAAAAAPRSSQR